MVKKFECIKNIYISEHEDCPRFVRMYKLHKYFRKIYSHARTLEEKDTLHIYPSPHILNMVQEKPVEKVFVVPTSFSSQFVKENANSIFAGIEIAYISLPIEIRFKTRDGLELPIIKYDPEKNIAFTLDLSHNMRIWNDYIEDLNNIIGTFISLLKPSADKKIYITVKEPITIGADTEVEMVENHRIIHAYDGFNDMGYSNWDDYPDLFGTRYGTIGVDGSGAQIELRPNYSEDPLKLLENHYALLEELRKKGFFYNLNAFEFPCGMHIHFGPSILNEHISQWLAPLVDICAILNRDPIPQQKIRLINSYGTETDFRKQRWGIEYRGFPSVILAVPYIAEKFFVGIYDIIREFTRKGYVKVNYKFWENLIEELREKVDKPYLFADLPQVEDFIVGSKFARWLEQKMLEELEAPYPYVSFYSLKRERGMVTAGLKTSLTEEIEHPSENTARKVFRFGIPYEWKKNGVPEEVWDDILKAIVEKATAGVPERTPVSV